MTKKALTKTQKEASEHFNGPALTLAIPGSGKTTLLLHRLINLVELHGVKSSEIMTLTFSKASAEDMKSRYESLFGHLPYTFSFMTIHKFAYGLFRSYLKNTGTTMTLLEEGAQKYHVLNDIHRKLKGETLSEDNFETLNNEIGLIYNLMLTEEDTQGHDFQTKDIFSLARAYHAYKKEHKLFDFDDMLLMAIRILKSNPVLLDNIRNKYKYLQVDEAQDTSKLQFELIELLLNDSKNLFLVADDDQSIYGFRGAFPSYLLDFPTHFKNAKVYYLADNFRSDANIVMTASAIIEKNKQRFSKNMKASHDATTKPVVRLFDDLFSRNEHILREINAHPNHTHAILYRNKVSSLSLIDAMKRHEISFQIKDTPIREFNHWLIEDILAFMTLALVPQDLDSFLKIAFKMNGFISREMINYVKLNQRGRSVFTVLVNIPFLEDYQTRTQERLQSQFETLKVLRPYDAIHYIETELGYLDYIKSNTQRLGLSMNYARIRLDAFKAIAKPLKSGFDFINHISDLKKYLQENVHNTHENVVLTTIHGAKGLEFDRVTLIDANQQIFPGYKSLEGEALEEERRLFYVCMTRAKSVFELHHVEFINGSYNPNSLFIDELLGQPLTNRLFNNATGKPAIG